MVIFIFITFKQYGDVIINDIYITYICKIIIIITSIIINIIYIVYSFNPH